jgi:hypothetical protein
MLRADRRVARLSFGDRIIAELPRELAQMVQLPAELAEVDVAPAGVEVRTSGLVAVLVDDVDEYHLFLLRLFLQRLPRVLPRTLAARAIHAVILGCALLADSLGLVLIQAALPAFAIAWTKLLSSRDLTSAS